MSAGEQPGEIRPTIGPAYFDRWYADMAASTTKDAIQRRHFALPDELGSAGVLHWDALAEIEAELRLQPGELLVDLACGRGGYGIELALRSGAQLIGVDFSGVALDRARTIAAQRLPPDRADFQLGTLTASGLASGTASAVMCTDSVQFAEPHLDALLEIRRVLRPGGRVALTTWQPTTPGDERLSPRLRQLDLDSELRAAGFTDIRVEERPAWRAAEHSLWAEAIAVPNEHDDPALASLQTEGLRSLENFDALYRVLAVASAP